MINKKEIWRKLENKKNENHKKEEMNEKKHKV